MKMFIILSFLIIFGCDNAKIISAKKISGYWINQQYADILIETRSPKDAYYPEGMYVPFFEVKGNSIQWGIHDGNGFRINHMKESQEKNHYEVYETKDKTTSHVFILNPDSLNKITLIVVTINYF